MNRDPLPPDARPGAHPDAGGDAWLTHGVPSRRVLAWGVDLLLAGLLAFALHAALLTVGLLTLGLGLPLLGVLPAVPFLYCWLWVAAAGATPGQAAFGLAVRRDRDLGPPDGLQALLYTLGFALTIATGALWLLVVLVTTRHRALHDMLSGVTVVRRGKADRFLRTFGRFGPLPETSPGSPLGTSPGAAWARRPFGSGDRGGYGGRMGRHAGATPLGSSDA